MTKLLRKFRVGLLVAVALVKNKVWDIRTPLWTNLFITNRCNLDCLYCFVDVNNKEIPEPTLTQLIGVIDEMKSMGSVLMVLLGGEPLLRKDLDQLVDHTLSNGMICEVLTNGHNIEQHLDTLKKVDSLCVSIDGDRESHDLNRGKGSYDRAISAIQFAVNNGIHTRIHATLTKNNIPHLDHVIGIAKQFNCKLNAAIAAVHTDNPALHFTNEEIKEFYTKLIEYKQKGAPISNAYSTMKFLSKWPGDFSFITNDINDVPQGVKPYACKRKSFTAYVNSDGFMYPCATIWGKHSAPNVFEVGAKKAWESIPQGHCKFCITEVEVNMLFNANIGSLFNVFSYLVIDPLKRKRPTEKKFRGK